MNRVQEKNIVSQKFDIPDKNSYVNMYHNRFTIQLQNNKHRKLHYQVLYIRRN